MLHTIAEATNGQGDLPDSALGPAVDAADASYLAAEISPEGRGSHVYHTVANHGTIPARDFASWLCLEKKCTRVSERAAASGLTAVRCLTLDEKLNRSAFVGFGVVGVSAQSVMRTP